MPFYGLGGLTVVARLLTVGHFAIPSLLGGHDFFSEQDKIVMQR